MKFTRQWVSEYTPVEDTPEEFSALLSDLGLEVEDLVVVGGVPSAVVVARVVDVRAHPDADRIRLVDVDPGDGTIVQVCCGASNMAPGDLVALAPVGTTMPDGMEIASRRMRGQVSDGMLCSARELTLGEDHEGIMILPADLVVGESLAEALVIQPDVHVDVDVLPNRPDALSVLGIARDVAARRATALVEPRPLPVFSSGPIEGVSVAVDAPDLCGRFAVCVLDDVTSGPSPDWLVRRLESAGMRPVNVVVDVTNFVMLELGQPSHAFDLECVPGGHLGVRWARPGETVTTLDGVQRRLEPSDGVVVDRDDRVLTLAGVMGGASTEISESTSSVLVEVAWWDPPSIAATAARLGLHSEASLRFKRGVDTAIGPIALQRIASLLVELTGARVRPGMLEVLGDLPAPAVIDLRLQQLNRRLGTAFSAVEVTTILESMGFVVERGPTTPEDAVVLRVTVPTWRPDCTIEVDLTEEVARMYGMSRLPRRRLRIEQRGHLSEAQRRRRAIRRALVGAGVSEAMPLPFLAPGDLERCDLPADGLLIANPLVSEESVLRTSLLPGLVSAVAYNVTHRSEGIRLFEIGRVFGVGARATTDIEASVNAGRVLDGEREVLGVALAGRTAPSSVHLLEAVLESIGILRPSLLNEAVPGLHPGRSARVVIDVGDSSTDVGVVGELHPVVLSRHGIHEPVAWLELDLSVILALPVVARRAQPVSRYPSADVDLAFVVDDSVPAIAVRQAILEAGGALVVAVRLFDVFRSDALGADCRNLAYSVRFQAPDRTLNDREVADLRQRIIESVTTSLGVDLRS